MIDGTVRALEKGSTMNDDLTPLFTIDGTVLGRAISTGLSSVSA